VCHAFVLREEALLLKVPLEGTFDLEEVVVVFAVLLECLPKFCALLLLFL
jgi:hypothetical protein